MRTTVPAVPRWRTAAESHSGGDLEPAALKFLEAAAELAYNSGLAGERSAANEWMCGKGSRPALGPHHAPGLCRAAPPPPQAACPWAACWSSTAWCRRRGGRQLAGGHGGRAAGSDAGGARGCVHGGASRMERQTCWKVGGLSCGGGGVGGCWSCGLVGDAQAACERSGAPPSPSRTAPCLPHCGAEILVQHGSVPRYNPRIMPLDGGSAYGRISGESGAAPPVSRPCIRLITAAVRLRQAGTPPEALPTPARTTLLQTSTRRGSWRWQARCWARRPRRPPPPAPLAPACGSVTLALSPVWWMTPRGSRTWPPSRTGWWPMCPPGRACSWWRLRCSTAAPSAAWPPWSTLAGRPASCVPLSSCWWLWAAG